MPTSTTPKVTNTRNPKSRKKWVLVSARFTSGETEELAQFNRRYAGDLYLYIKHLTESPSGMIEEIFIS